MMTVILYLQYLSNRGPCNCCAHWPPSNKKNEPSTCVSLNGDDVISAAVRHIYVELKAARYVSPSTTARQEGGAYVGLYQRARVSANFDDGVNQSDVWARRAVGSY